MNIMKNLASNNRIFSALIMSLFFLARLTVHASICNWTNTAGGNWSNANNWSPNQVPGAADTAVITNAGNYSVILDVSPTVAGVVLGAGSGGTTQNFFTGGQTITVNGQIQVNSQGQFNLNGGALAGTYILVGSLTLSGGSLAGVMTVASNGVLNLVAGGGNDDLNGLVLTNYGTVAWAAGSLQGGTIYNYGLWDCQSDQTISGGTFNNYGTLRKSGGIGSGSTFFNDVLNQLAGVVDVQNGTNGLQLELADGGNFLGGYITTNQFGETGLAGGAFNINGTVTGTNTVMAYGWLVGANVIQGGLTWIGWPGSPDWNNASSVTVATNSTLVINGGTNNLGLNVVSMSNSGTVEWLSGSLQGGTIYNYGLWDCQSDQTISGGTFNNYGTLRKSGGGPEFSGSTTFNVVFNQLAGVIDVQNGTNGLGLGLTAGGNFLGGYITTNQFGETGLAGGAFNINGTVTGTNTVMAYGWLVGANVIQGGLTWIGWPGSPDWNNASSVTVATNSTLVINGGTNNLGLNVVSMSNSGTIEWLSGSLQGGTIYNYGLWDCQSDQTISGGTFNNYGILRKTGTSGGSSVINLGVSFNNPGRLDSQLGNISLQGANSLAGGTLNFGINSPTNYGTISLSGAAALTGTLGVVLHGYTPQLGDSFPLITYGSKTGAFTSFQLLAGVNWQETYGSTVYTLSVGAPLNFSLAVSRPAWTANGFNLMVSGPVNSNYTIQVSANLAETNWSALTCFASTFTQTPFTDTNATKTDTNRFYRALMH